MLLGTTLQWKGKVYKKDLIIKKMIIRIQSISIFLTGRNKVVFDTYTYNIISAISSETTAKNPKRCSKVGRSSKLNDIKFL